MSIASLAYGGKIGNRWPKSLRRLLPAVLTLALGLILSIILFLSMHRHEQQREDSSFERRADAHVTAVRDRLGDAIQALQVINQTFTTFGPISRGQFHAFVQPLLERYPYIQNFSLHRLVSKAERPAFEAEMRKHYPGFSISDIVDGKRVAAGERDSYRVISYLEPMAGNARVFGLDAAVFNPLHEEAIRRAAETGRASASGLFSLTQTAAAQSGFSVIMPVYRHDPASGARESPRRDIIGYTLANFRASDAVHKILQAADLLSVPTDISVYVGAVPDERNLAFRRGSAPSRGRNASLLPGWLFRDQPQTLSRTFDVVGVAWHMRMSAPPNSLTDYHRGSLSALLLGIIFSLLAAAYMRALGLRSYRIYTLVEERTAELKRANRRLVKDIAARRQAEHKLRHTQHILTNAQKVAHLGSWEIDLDSEEIRCSDEFFRICGLEPHSIKPTLEFALSIVHPDDREAARKAIDLTKKEFKEYKIEKRIIRPDGSIRHVISHAEVIFNGTNNRGKVAGSFLDITEHKQAEIALRQSQEKLRELAAHLERVKEEERKRIAREIHDELGALLTGIKAYLSVTIDRAALTGTAPDELLVDAAKLADAATEMVRRVIADLRPSVLDELGVWAALDWYVGQIEKRAGLACECVIDESAGDADLDPERSTMLFRIVQEALTNVVRHAEASHVTVRVKRQWGCIVAEIEDDGKGLDAGRELDRKSWGIVGMDERARYFGGDLTITGVRGQGTTVVLRLPLEDAHAC